MLGKRQLLGVVIGAVLAAGGVSAGSRSEDHRAARPVEEPPATTSAPRRPAAATPDTAAPSADRRVVAASTGALRTHDGCAPLLDHVREQALGAVTASGLGGLHAVMPAASMPAAEDSSATAASGAATGASSYSTTNLQEAGAEEPDVVVNDGTRAFTLFGGVLRSIDIGGGAATVRDTVDLGLPADAEVLLAGDRLVVMSSPDPSVTRVVVIDAATLDVLHRVDVEGTYLSARRIGDAIRLVVTQNGPAFAFTYPESESTADAQRALDHNRGAILRADLAEWLPDVTVDGSQRLVPAPACDRVFTTSTFAGPGSTTVVTLSPDDGAVLDATSVLATATEVYATTAHLYVATSAWQASGAPMTEIHRFDIADPGRSVYEASGSVPGRLLRPAWFAGASQLGQWSLSEHEGDLRVATTVEAADASLASAVTVLRRERDLLLPIGHLGGLGPGEQLYAVRFLGTLGYVVTYERVDPLFVLDLRDPSAPALAGELKVPGYSSYLHPIGDGHLLGVGQDDPDEDGFADGSQVSVFDVRDPARPARSAHLRLGQRGTVAGAESDHRTFTWWSDPARAVVTMSDFEDTTRFQGAVVLDVTGDAITEVGRVEHRDDGARCAAPIVRSRVVGDDLLTFSEIGVRVHALSDLTPRDLLRYGGARSTGPCTTPHGDPPPTSTSTTTSTTSTTSTTLAPLPAGD